MIHRLPELEVLIRAEVHARQRGLDLRPGGRRGTRGTRRGAVLGIDLGTSSVKVVALSASGKILGLGSVEYPILTPQPGWAEQDPEQWWNATAQAVHERLTKTARWRCSRPTPCRR